MCSYTKTLTFTIPEITICQHSCSGLQRITLKTETNLANIDSCQPLEICLSTGQIIAFVLCICRNSVLRDLALVISFSCGCPVSEVFLFITKCPCNSLSCWLLGHKCRAETLQTEQHGGEVGYGKCRSMVSKHFWSCIPLSVKKFWIVVCTSWCAHTPLWRPLI